MYPCSHNRGQVLFSFFASPALVVPFRVCVFLVSHNNLSSSSRMNHSSSSLHPPLISFLTRVSPPASSKKVLTWFHFFLYSNALSLTQSLSLCIWCMYVRVCLSIAKQYFVHTAEPLCVSVDDEDGDPTHTPFLFLSLSLYTYIHVCVFCYLLIPFLSISRQGYCNSFLLSLSSFPSSVYVYVCTVHNHHHYHQSEDDNNKSHF